MRDKARDKLITIDAAVSVSEAAKLQLLAQIHGHEVFTAAGNAVRLYLAVHQRDIPPQYQTNEPFTNEPSSL